MPATSASPAPSRTGLTARCSSSMRPAPRYCRSGQRPACGTVARRPTSLSSFHPARSSHGTEHISSQDPRAETRQSFLGDCIVDARFSAIRIALHAVPDARREEPVHEQRATDTEGILKVLFGSGAKPVERYRKAADTNFGQDFRLTVSEVRG